MVLLLLLLPLVASIICLATPNYGKKIALGASLFNLLLTAIISYQFIPDASSQFGINYWWIQRLGISFHLGVDGISLVLLWLTNGLMPLIVLADNNTIVERKSLFYSMMLLMQAALVGVFTSLDGFLFYLFWELALIPIYIICLLWGGENRIKITLKFFIYTLAGSLVMLIGLIYLYLQTPGTHSFDIQVLYNTALSLQQESYLFWAFFIAFAIKMPIFPLHTWQPDTYTTAPTQGTMLLSGIMLKMGIYGVIRWLLPIFPHALIEYQYLVILLCVIGVVYASCIAIVQKDFKRMIAYSSIAHVGLIGAGILSLSLQGLQGSMIQMISHGVNVVGLFFIADILHHRIKSNQMDSMGGIRAVAPKFATYFIIILLGSVAMPLTNGFVGEFLLINGLFQFNSTLAAVAGLTVILGAVYMLVAYQKICLGATNSTTATFADTSSKDAIVLIPIVVLVFTLGLLPNLILNLSEAAINNLFNIIQLKGL